MRERAGMNEKGEKETREKENWKRRELGRTWREGN
jgi:hypothetical protein